MVSDKKKISNKRYDDNNMAVIAVKAKKEVINDIKTTANDLKVTSPKLLTACYNYCMDNNIDIKSYIK